MICLKCKYNKEETYDFCKFESKRKDNDVFPDCYLLDNRYLLKFMCSGGYSNIYKAYDLHKKQIVIAKECYIKGCYLKRDEVNKFLIPNPSSVKRLSDKLELFIKEAKKLNRVDHINIFPKMYNIIKLNDYNVFIIMEFLEGTHIWNINIKNSRSVLKLYKPFIADLRVMHSNNIIHRDLHFRNLLVVDGKIKLVDLGIAKRLDVNKGDGESELDTEALVTTVSAEKPPEHRKHLFQDSRTDVYSLAKIIWETYKRNNIQIPNKVIKVLEKASDNRIEKRYNIETLYLKLYGNRKRKYAVVIVCFILSIFIQYRANMYINTKQNIVREKSPNMQSHVYLRSEMIKAIQDASGYHVPEYYVLYTDFDADGKDEMFAFVPTDVDYGVKAIDDEHEWINYGEIWFSDGMKTIKVDDIEMDEWQGGGFYNMNLLQFGKVYHVQLSKFYEYAISQGPANVYAYENGIPVRTYEGYINNSPLIDDGKGNGVYRSVQALKGTTQMTVRTWDKIYVYYKDGEYIDYESENIDIDNLKGYENFDTVIDEGIKRILLMKNASINGGEVTITPGTELINSKTIDVYRCEYKEITLYITLYNCYYNARGCIYLNLVCWYDKNDFLKSSIWDDDEWHLIYGDPVETVSVEEYGNEGFNYYIIFKDHKTELDIEEINSGFWEGQVSV